MELAQFMDPPRQNRTTDASRPKESLVYYRHLMYCPPCPPRPPTHLC